MALAGCSVVGIRSGTEEPSYRLLATVGQVQIRQYAPRLAASVTLRGDEIQTRAQGFRRLARYIFGANANDASISMTAPVAQSAAESSKISMTQPVAQSQQSPGTWTISFFMPAKYTRSNLPKPVDPGISINDVPAETFGVLRFSGIPTTPSVVNASGELLSALSGSNWQPEGAPVAWFYDPPWTIPWLRRNEVAVLVKRPS